MEKHWTVRIRGWVLLAAIAATMILVVLFYKGIQEKVWGQTQVNLKDVASQNTIAVEKEIAERQNFLLGMAKQLQQHEGDTVQELLETFEPYVEIYQFKRMGFVDQNGMAYTTDGYQQDLSYRDFYTRSMQGENVITGVLEDTLGEAEKINVFSVPVYRKSTGKVEGVLFATYRTKKFTEFLSTDSFEGEGYGLIIGVDGTMVADSKKNPAYGTQKLFQTLSEKTDDEGRQEIKEMRAAMEENKSGTAELKFENTQSIYYSPIDNQMDEQWYMLTVVPRQTFVERVRSLMGELNRMLVCVLVVFLITLVIYLYSYHRDKSILVQLAYQDSLTGGDNYACFCKKMAQRRASECDGYLVAVDFADFKIINSTCGVTRGDEALQWIWRAIDNGMRRDEYAAHINADHFILYLLAEQEEEIGERLQQLTHDFATVSEHLHTPDLVPYYGVYRLPDTEDVESGYNKANQAKHLAKHQRRKNYAFYEDVDYARVLEEKQLTDGFEEAIRTHAFEVWYQPKYSTQDATPVGAEALVRWRRADGSLIPPFKFIPLFEKNGFIARLDEYVFDEVCRRQKEWLKEGKHLLPVSINISRASLYYTTIVEKYVKIVQSYEVPIEYIQLEITESAMIENSEVRELIDRFHANGFQLLLDDFGNGYSSLAALNTLHFDVLKVDKSLIDYIGNEDGEKLLSCIMELAGSLGLRTTAEGVESIEQVRFLQSLHCTDIQGYYFSKPLPQAEYEEVIA